MNDLFEIKVECHAGYKSDEYPKRFFWEGICFEIEEILDRWYQGDTNPEFPRANYFKVRAVNQKTFILKNEIQNNRWFLWIRDERLDL